MIKVKKLSSLDKVFLNEEPKESCNIVDAIFKNETLSFQIAYYYEDIGNPGPPATIKVVVEDNFESCIRLRSVGNVPSEMPAYSTADEDYITTRPGLFPDPLYDMPDGVIKLVPFQWRSIWVDFDPEGRLSDGDYIIDVKFIQEDGIELACVRHTLEVIDAKLPKQDLIHTEWMHYDCIGAHYGVEMLSEPHWELIERYIRTASEHGVNMILTPLFTPPLDTKPGGERPTVQLVRVKVQNGKYSFDFSALKRFVDMCLNIGMEYFEMSHLFTQWGANAAPKIIAEVDGVEKRIFGWDTEAAGPQYSNFLECFLKELTKTLKDWDIAEKCFFHVSDEPNMTQFESYKAASDLVGKCLTGFNIIDALSDFEFYEKGIIKTPIPASNHIEPFINAKVRNLWTYYCCGQYLEVSNRFMSMPGRRNRIIATQLYKYDIAGFLQWGFNFWFSQYSIKKINPYSVTDAGNAFPSGDAFLVYPGEDGYPVESIRLKVFREALFDLRAMKLLESMTSKEFVMGIIEEGLDKPITFSEYPRSEQYITNMRNRINEEIKARLQGSHR